MSLENFLSNALDNGVIERYLQSLAVQHIQLEHINAELNGYRQLSQQAAIQIEEQARQIKQLLTQTVSINSELNQLKQQSKFKAEEQESQIRQLTTQSETINTVVKKLKQRSKIVETRVNHFIVRSDGTALDTETGLTWCRYSIGQRWENGTAFGKATKIDSSKIKEVVTAFNTNAACGGFTDWRLPTLDELQRIYEAGNMPPINKIVFPNTPTYWFLTSTKHNNGGHTILQFGFIDYEQDDVYVRLVC